MRTEQEILDQFEKLKVSWAEFNSKQPEMFDDLALCQNLISAIQWVLGNSEREPNESFGWVYARITPEGMEIGRPGNIAIPFKQDD